MKALTKPLLVLFALFFITLTSCTAEDLNTDQTTEAVSSDPEKEDPNPPAEPND